MARMHVLDAAPGICADVFGKAWFVVTCIMNSYAV